MRIEWVAKILKFSLFYYLSTTFPVYVDMLVYKAYKVEIDPNNKQATLLKKGCGVARFTWNWGLDQVKNHGEKPNGNKLSKKFNSIKDKQFPWVREVSKCASQEPFHNLNQAYKRMYEEDIGEPNFKKKNDKNSFEILQSGINVSSTHIKIPKIKTPIRLKEHDYIPPGKYDNVAISYYAGKWFVSVRVKEEINPQNINTETLGIDLGIKNLITCSDGATVKPDRTLYKKEKKLKRLQRQLARRKKDGQNRKKTQRKLAKQHAKIACKRKDLLHKTTTMLTKTKQAKTIVMEDLKIENMVKNHNLAKALLNVGMGEFRRQMEYKCQREGIDLIFADPFFPSSKKCSGCGHVKKKLKLSERIYHCERCGLVLDRDLNAALNLKQLHTVGSTGINACEDDKVHEVVNIDQVIVDKARIKQGVAILP